jgi:serine/threonine protein kinase
VLKTGLQIDTVILEQKIGEGGQGQVWKVRDRMERSFAAKLVLLPQDNSAITKVALKNEIEKIKNIKNRYVVRLFEPLYDTRCVDGYTVLGYTMEYAPDGTLQEQENGIELRKQPDVLLEFLKNLSHGLQAIHEAQIIHNDIKPSNVLVFHELGEIFPSISDFGAAAYIAKELNFVGTYRYMAPERFKGLPGTEKSDVYSLALVVFEILSGHYPYMHSISPLTSDTDREAFSRVHQVSEPDWETLSDFVPLQSILKRMLEKSPEKRPGLRFFLEELESVRLVRTRSSGSGGRIPLKFFDECKFVWHPKLHEIFGCKKYIYAMKSAHHAEDIQKLYSAIRNDTSLSCTLMRVLGKNDILASVWENKTRQALQAMERLDKDNRAETLERYEIDLVIINPKAQRKKYDWLEMSDRQVIDRLLILFNESNFEEDRLRNDGFVVDTIYAQKKHDEVRIVMNIECNTKRLEDAELRHICTDIFEYLDDAALGQDGIVKKAVYGCVDRHNIFVECVIRGYYRMSEIIYGMIDYIEKNRPDRIIHYVYNSHLESDLKGISSSDDGYIISILDKEMSYRNP